MKSIELKPIRESTEDYERIEARIKRVFREALYYPLLKELRLPVRTVLQNAASPLITALESGRVTFYRGLFSGAFSAAVSKELRAMGAVWDRRAPGYRLPSAKLPPETRHAVDLSQARFKERLAAVDRKLAKILPEEIAGMVQVTDLFDSTLWKVDRQLKATLDRITVAPELTAHRRKRIAEEWQGNMDLWIKDFAEEEIAKLRKAIKESSFAGSRYEAAVGSIQRSYGVTAAKAKFLARQETSLLMTKFKETRYTDSGVHKYRWRCVVGSKLHPVRPSHKILDGKIFRWDAPPITTAPTEPTRRNNPGQDYNCRCAAIPIVDFRESPG